MECEGDPAHCKWWRNERYYTSTMRLVSVVLTELNEVQDIERSISSLLAQVPPAAEVVVVDGGSTDGAWEWLAAAQKQNEVSECGARLVVIRDETCSLRFSAGPVSRGRNVAIAAAKSEIIACADAGCTYAPDWLKNLTAPLAAGIAEYALGGSCIDPNGSTVWDVAAAPFFSIKLGANEPTKSCTARSMAFTRQLWERIGGFPESVLVGEDTLFDIKARQLTTPAFIPNAKAFYRPHYTFRSACYNLARYAVSDGMAGVRWARLFRNAARCVAEVLAIALLHWSAIPLAVILAFEVWQAFHRDFRFLIRFGVRAVAARFVFSLAVPWVVAVNQIRGRFRKKPQTNRQNA
jgi:glycosyltransferase involved in cell wall biosynthesis